MKRYIIIAAMLSFAASGSQAQNAEDEAFLDTSFHTIQDVLWPKKKWKYEDKVSLPQFGGYVIGSYKYSGQEGAHGGEGFDLRLVRAYVSGTVLHDFKYRLQVELNNSPHIKDAYLAWSHWQELEVKFGQFKRCFGFENPYNPWDVGFGDYSQLTKKLTGFGDRCGEPSSGGRDIGVQVQGDFLKIGKDKRRVLHYAVGVFNGQGINSRDRNNRKDFIANIQGSPIQDLWVGIFAWSGGWTSPDGVPVDRRRYIIGANYEGRDNHLSARFEYAHSKGHKASDFVAATETENPYWKGGGKADAWYITVGYPIWKWIKVYAKYDMYRDYATKASSHNIFGLAVNAQPHKNLKLQLQYNYHNDHTALDREYSQFWVQTYVRF